MSSIFSKPKSKKPPPLPAPEAIPEIDDDTGTAAARKARSRSGFRKTILAGGLTPKTGKKKLLG